MYIFPFKGNINSMFLNKLQLLKSFIDEQYGVSQQIQAYFIVCLISIAWYIGLISLSNYHKDFTFCK